MEHLLLNIYMLTQSELFAIQVLNVMCLPYRRVQRLYVLPVATEI